MAPPQTAKVPRAEGRHTSEIPALSTGPGGQSMGSVWNPGLSYAVELHKCWGSGKRICAEPESQSAYGQRRQGQMCLPSGQLSGSRSRAHERSQCAEHESRRGSLWSARCAGQLSCQWPALRETVMMERVIASYL